MNGKSGICPLVLGLTFNQQAWDRYCDTNNDGVMTSQMMLGD